jgi:UDP-3-O-[3-hydroxymyristoyl] glucosamine N-acyltransferase
VTLGDGVIAGAQAGIPSSLEAGARVLGTPARPIVQAKRIMVAEMRLPERLQRVRVLEQRLERLTARLGEAEGPGGAA